MRVHTLLAFLLAAALTGISAMPQPVAAGNNLNLPAQATTPLLSGTTQPVKVAFGDQTNPHVACNIASYTDDDFFGTSLIKYFDFATNTEHVIPGNGIDRLSATDGNQIVFTQLDAEGDHVVLYDIASQTSTQIPGVGNSSPAIGGNLVAFVHSDSTNASTFEISVYDETNGTTTQLTNDTMLDHGPAVSPDGNVVVWKKCQSNDGRGCDIYSATRTGPGAFTTRLVGGAGEDQYADTNGELVAYISDKSGENDIYLQRVGGSTEMHLSIPGDQRDLRMSGNLLVFESQTADRSYDVFLYDLSSARLYQVTNTPGVDETLSDVVAGCNGLNRIVYAIAGGFGDFDIYSFTFQLNHSVEDQLNDLIALVQSFNLHDGTEASLITKLQDALAAVNGSNTPTACDSLTAFINASQAQSGKKLTADQVNQLVAAATQIKLDLGCH